MSKKNKKTKKLSIEELKVESFDTSLNDFNRQTIQGGNVVKQVSGDPEKCERTEHFGCEYTEYKPACDLSAIGHVGTCGTDKCGTCDDTCQGWSVIKKRG